MENLDLPTVMMIAVVIAHPGRPTQAASPEGGGVLCSSHPSYLLLSGDLDSGYVGACFEEFTIVYP